MTARNNRKKTDISVPEPRHRVGPKGVSSGISFRDLPPPSLEEIKKVCEHYQTKCAGTYKSLASRYVYQMSTEIEQLVDALREGGYDVSEESLSTMDARDFSNLTADEPRKTRSTKRPPANSSARVSRNSNTRHSTDNRNANANSFSRNQHLHGSRTRPRTASASTRKPSHESYRRRMREFHYDSTDTESAGSPPPRTSHHSSSQRRRGGDSLPHRNLEDQNEEVLRWLKEEMKRSQSLIKRTNHLHDAELINAKKEMEKVKRAAKLLIKAVHKKGKDKAAKSEANAESERRRRMKSQKTIESMIHSHSAQIDLLQRGLRHDSRDVNDSRDYGRFYPWGELQDDKTDVSFSLSDASDLTSVLDDLAEEAYQQSCC